MKLKKEIRNEYSKEMRSGRKKKVAKKNVMLYELLNFDSKKIVAISRVLNFVIENIDMLSKVPIDELQKIQFNYEKKLNDELIFQSKEYNFTYELIKVFFLDCYSSFSKGRFIDENTYWSRIDYVECYNINVCPYCNAQFIFTIRSDNQNSSHHARKIKKEIEKDSPPLRRGTSPELDHFIPKDKYPLLAMSPYNLVPCCKVCNQSLKGTIDFNYQDFYSPFEQGIENAFRFSRNFSTGETTSIDYVNTLLGNSKDFAISIKYKHNHELDTQSNIKFKTKVDNNIKYFRLEEIYSFHKDYLQKIITQSIIYNNLYKHQLKASFPDLFTDLDKIFDMTTLPENFKDNLLSKLITDVITDEQIQSKKRNLTSLFNSN
ncbi:MULTISPECIES: HNH endonuclease [Exiguobacterium]|nr:MULTISPECIES: hypothetical protein [Exiguobacterium]MCT4776473.1 hypothetical protein [Exiguobacterium aquaticum]MCT4788293.1 hypothetical protein [Exiguobacterium mexicanum]